MFQPHVVSALSSDASLEKALGECNGILRITDLSEAPLADIGLLLDFMAANKEFGARANAAYTNNLVYKDSFQAGRGASDVDQKRVLDLSPERLNAIKENDPALHELVADRMPTVFFETLSKNLGTRLVKAMSCVIGSQVIAEDSFFNYRMIDYYPRQGNSVSPRCGTHRDFGTFTLIFSNEPGLSIFVNGEWKLVDPGAADSALLVFGWCSQILSNGRLPAIEHKVVECPDVARRVSAVLFCAPKGNETVLNPVVLPGEKQAYVSGVKVSELREIMAKKWRRREGTLSEKDALEENIAKDWKNQDEIVRVYLAI